MLEYETVNEQMLNKTCITEIIKRHLFVNQKTSEKLIKRNKNRILDNLSFLPKVLAELVAQYDTNYYYNNILDKAIKTKNKMKAREAKIKREYNNELNKIINEIN